MKLEESVCLLAVLISCMVCCSSAFTLFSNDDDELAKFSEQQEEKKPTVNYRHSFNQRHKLLLQNAHMDDMIKDPINFNLPNSQNVKFLSPEQLNPKEIKKLVDNIVGCNYDENCINAINDIHHDDGDDEDDDNNDDCDRSRDGDLCDQDSGPDSEERDFDPWTLVWYIGSFGGLIVFFLMVSCSEWCCKKYHTDSPEAIAAAASGNQSSRSGGASATTEHDSPPPGYHLFAPPDYDHAKEKEQFDVYVVPTHTVNQVLVNQIRFNNGTSGAPPLEQEEDEDEAVVVRMPAGATAPAANDLPPSYSSLGLVADEHQVVCERTRTEQLSLKYPDHMVQCS